MGVSTEQRSSNYNSGQPVAYLDFHIFVALFGMKIEVYDLWAQACLHLSVHLVTGFYKSFSQLHMISCQSVVSSQRQSTRQKANQVILQDKTTRSGKNIKQTDVCVCAPLCPPMCVSFVCLGFVLVYVLVFGFVLHFRYQYLEGNFLTI